MSYLTMAVKLHQENPELNLSFYNFSDYFCHLMVTAYFTVIWLWIS